MQTFKKRESQILKKLDNFSLEETKDLFFIILYSLYYNPERLEFSIPIISINKLDYKNNLLYLLKEISEENELP